MKKFCFVIFCFIFSFIIFSGCSANSMINKNDYQIFDSKEIDVSKISSTENLVETCKPAVVGILATSGRYQSIGTGVCIKKGAYVLTNNHVVEDANVVQLYLSDGSTANAQIVWTDASSDLAMLKSSVDIPYLPVASSGSYDSGDEVIAIGTPIDLAFKHSATKGIISATNRTIAVDNDYGESTLYNLIQHDASINPGNSGGPLINMNGEVIGINTVKVQDAEGMGFAIPVETFKNVIEKVSANGSYETTYMGVFGYDNQLKHIGTETSGFYVQSVAKDSPAQKVGLVKGDVIKSINGKEISIARNLKSELYACDVGDTAQITFERDGKVQTVQVKLEKHPYAYCATKLLAR
jgi:S1-C subfamily serine protease